MTRPHPVLIRLAAAGPLGPIADYPVLVRSAIEHRMEGLLWSAVAEDPTASGNGWRRELAVVDLLNRRRNETNQRALVELVQRASSLGIAVAAVKGVSTEARWYGRIGERPSGDVDLVLGPDQLDRAADLVAAFQPDHPLLDDVGDLVDRRILQSIELRVGSAAVDLHFDLMKTGAPSRRPTEVWAEMISYRIADQQILVPSAELALVHALIHLTKDRFRHLLGYVDVQRMASDPETDVERAFEIAARQDLGGHTALAYSAVAEVLPMPRASAQRVSLTSKLAWRTLWPPSVRLRGNEGLKRFRWRQDAIPLTADTRRARAMIWWIRRSALPPKNLLEYRGVGSGSYVSRLTVGRLAATRKRRRASEPQDGDA